MKRMLIVLAAVLLVLPLSSCWIFNKLMGVNADWDGPTGLVGGSSSSSAAIIGSDMWYTDTINSGETLWYRIWTSPYSSYRIYWDDSDGSGTYDADISVAAVCEDGTSTYQGSIDNGYNTPMTITAQEPMVFLRVTADIAGDFAIGYETDTHE